MAELGLAVNLSDLANVEGQDGKIAKVIEVLSRKYEILDDMMFVEGNEKTGNKSTQRTGLPDAYYRKINAGIPKSKATTKQITDACAMLESRSQIDEDLVNISNDKKAFRWSQDLAHMEALRKGLATGLFYGDTTINPEQFMGLHARFSTPSDDDSESGYNMIDGGGQNSTNTSIWLINWGPNTAHGIYPQGMKSGLDYIDQGVRTVTDADGNEFEAYCSKFRWNVGLSVPDWRSIVRICNVDVATLTADESSGAKLIDLMTVASELYEGDGNPAFYCTPKIKTFLKLQMRKRGNVNLTMEEFQKKRNVLMFDGIPIRKTPKNTLLQTEAKITGTFEDHL